MTTSTKFCADEARKDGDPLAGTASVATTWILVEHREPWGHRAVEEDPLPDSLREWLRAAERSHEPARITFVRRVDRRTGPLRVFLVRTGEREQCLWCKTVEDPEEVADLDLSGLEAGTVGDMEPVSRPLLLVCGNARRDRCCARRGLPMYEALDRAPGNVDVWLSTHLGGHRYAAVAVALPLGAQYGFLGVEDAERLLRATESGDLSPPGFRGRSFYPPVVQAADCFLRQELGAWGGGAVRWVEEASDLGAGSVALRSGEGTYRVMVRADRREALVSCGPEKVKEITEHALVSIRRVDDALDDPA